MFRLLILSLWLSAAALRADTSTNLPPALSGVAEFNAGYQSWDEKSFARASELFQQATAQAPDNATNFYWLGASEFHRMLLLRSLAGQTTVADAAQAAALKALNQAVKLDPHQAESHALLGTIYGIRISDLWVRAIFLGPRVMSQRDAALADGGKNPRVRYLLGTCEFYTASKPADWEKTLQTFLLAEKLFEAEATEPVAPLEPRWGRSSCRTFIGLTYEKLGERALAADYFRKALAENTTDSLARAGLARVSEIQSKSNQP